MGRGVGCPFAVRVAATDGVDWILWKRERKMALRTKRHPFPASSNPFPKLHIANKSNLFAKQFLERLQLLFCLLVINTLTFKLRLKAAFLRLQCCYLTFRLRKTVKRKRNALSGEPPKSECPQARLWRLPTIPILEILHDCSSLALLQSDSMF
jgi:hypothetical protein